MEAPELLQELSAMGLRISVDGNDLRVSPKTAITSEVRQLVRAHKTALLAALRRSHSGPQPPVGSLSQDELREVAGEDWADIKGDPKALKALGQALQTQRMRQRGERPTHYTQVVECQGCGPVWLWEGAPKQVLACPWCLNRATGAPIPRPARS